MPDEDKALNSQGASAADLDDGQGTKGAPVAPKASEAPKKEVKDTEPKKGEEEPKTDDEEPGKEPADKEPAKTDDKDKEVTEPTEWVKFNDPSADAAIDLMKTGGMSVEDAEAVFAEAVQNNDLSKVDYGTLVEKLGKSTADLVMIGVKDFYGKHQTKVAETIKTVHTAIGGEEAWNTVSAWAKKRAESDKGFQGQMTELAAMIDKGGFQAKAAASELKQLYEADPKNTSLVTSTVTPTKRAETTNSGALSRADYLVAVKAAQMKGDNAEVARLRERRAAGRATGI